MQILPTTQEENDVVVQWEMIAQSTIAKFSILYDIPLVSDWKRKLKSITLGSERVNKELGQV